MKHLLPIMICMVLFFSCRKAELMEAKPPTYLENVKASLKDSLGADLFQRLDFDKSILSTINPDSNYLRIPIKERLLKNEFVIVRTDDKGIIKSGKMISLAEEKKASARRMTKYRSFNGHIVIKSLKGEVVVASDIVQGYIVAFHKKKKGNKDALVQPSEPAYKEMPEVVVVGYTNGGSSHGIYSYIDYISFGGMFGTPHGGGGNSNYYASLDGYSGTYANYGYTITPADYQSGDSKPKSGNSTIEEPPLYIDFEHSVADPAIDLKKYLNCFASIPDAGATCSIEIFTDIPVDRDPNKLFNFESGSPGHTFIQLKKTNGVQSAVQNIGFYPTTGWKNILSNAPMQGKFVNNSEHEFNGSLKMNLSPQNFRQTLNQMLYLANFVKYDIDNYNCTDFALDVFNHTRTEKLHIPLYDLPGNYPSTGSSTPQGLYNKLKQMKQTGSPEANNITVNIVKGWVANSTGPCN